MKPKTEPTLKNPAVALNGATRKSQRSPQPEALAEAGGAKTFRRLKWNELVSHGDFISDGNRGFEPWDGPTGFRADAFVKPIYRREKGRAVAAGRTT